MVFSSLVFIFVFLPITIAAYYIAPKSLRNVFLLIASLVFYAWGEPVYIVLMVFSILVSYTGGLLIDSYRKRRLIAQIFFITAMVINLGLLCFFKYYGFILANINHLTSLHMASAALPLPLGISFYTFQSISYLIDIYRGKVPVQKNIITFGMYKSMFPQLVAGPIVKYVDIFQELDRRNESLGLFGEGAELFIIGLAKKVLLANNIALLWKTINAMPMGELSVLSAWLGIVAFTFQIYFDFSGYTDMALGLGKMLGFHLPQNFNYPYVSRTVTEFWRRWHISLGSWFREYVYIPLGGNREGLVKQLRNLIVVWFLTGLWHGASWNFVLWGLYFGAFVTAEKLFLIRWLEHRPRWLGHIYTMLVVMVGWVLFEYESLGQAARFIGRLFGYGSPALWDGNGLYYLYTNGVLLLVLALCSTPLAGALSRTVARRLGTASAVVIPVVYMGLLLLCTAYLVNESYNPFLYFRF